VERTVKRRDADRGLPIHRVPGGGRASVYAYTAELDEWLKSTQAPEPDDAMPTESSGAAFGAVDASAMASSRVPEASAP